jgi:uncharacterized protein (UPF0332 family)
MISADDILELAGGIARVASLGTEEARCRSAVSRAYYSAFHFAKEFLGEFEIIVSAGPSGHGEVYRYLFNCGFPTARAAASLLDELRRSRNQADYDLAVRRFESCASAVYHIQEAADIKSDLVLCRQNRAAIRAGLAAWKANPASR